MVNNKTKSLYVVSPTLNQVTILFDADEIFPYIYKMITTAKQSIDIEMYLLEGKIGQKIIELLQEQAQRGVLVRIIYQPPSSLELYQKIMRFLHTIGIKNRAKHYQTFYQILQSNKLIHVADFPLHLFKRKLTFKMAHNKTLIIDDKEAIAGGMNFASITEKNHDVMVAVQGPIVWEMKKVFEYNWSLAGGENLMSSINEYDSDFQFKNTEKLVWMTYHVTMPYLENTKEFLLSKIRSVKKRILLEMYLLSDQDLINELISTYNRGIEIRILLDANRLPLEFDLAGFPNKAAIHKLLKAKIPVKIYRCAPGQEMHMKLALFDNDEVMVGSTNWTFASFNANSESCFFIRGKHVFENFRTRFEEDWTQNSNTVVPLTFIEKIISTGFTLLNRVY